MTPKIKKIIAREGFVILGIIVVSCLIFLLSSIYPPVPKQSNIYDGLTSTEKSALKELTELREQFPEYDDLDNLTLAEKLAKKFSEYKQVYVSMKSINIKNKEKKVFDISTAKMATDSLGKRHLITPLIPKAELERRQVTKIRGTLFNTGFLCLIYGYPAYLLISFIVWMIKTIRG